MRKLTFTGLSAIALFIAGCDLFGPVEPVGPAITTGQVTDALQTSFRIGGTISRADYKNSRQEKKSGRVIEYGFVYGNGPIQA